MSSAPHTQAEISHDERLVGANGDIRETPIVTEQATPWRFDALDLRKPDDIHVTNNLGEEIYASAYIDPAGKGLAVCKVAIAHFSEAKKLLTEVAGKLNKGKDEYKLPEAVADAKGAFAFISRVREMYNEARAEGKKEEVSKTVEAVRDISKSIPAKGKGAIWKTGELKTGCEKAQQLAPGKSMIVMFFTASGRSAKCASKMNHDWIVGDKIIGKYKEKKIFKREEECSWS